MKKPTKKLKITTPAGILPIAFLLTLAQIPPASATDTIEINAIGVAMQEGPLLIPTHQFSIYGAGPIVQSTPGVTKGTFTGELTFGEVGATPDIIPITGTWIIQKGELNIRFKEVDGQLNGVMTTRLATLPGVPPEVNFVGYLNMPQGPTWFLAGVVSYA